MTTKDPAEANMTYVEILDYRAQEHKHEMERNLLAEKEATKRAKIQRSAARQETYQWLGIGALIAAVIISIVVAIYLANRNDPADPATPPEERREIACIDDGGGWIPKDMLADSSTGLCVYPNV